MLRLRPKPFDLQSPPSSTSAPSTSDSSPPANAAAAVPVAAPPQLLHVSYDASSIVTLSSGRGLSLYRKYFPEVLARGCGPAVDVQRDDEQVREIMGDAVLVLGTMEMGGRSAEEIIDNCLGDGNL